MHEIHRKVDAVVQAMARRLVSEDFDRRQLTSVRPGAKYPATPREVLWQDDIEPP
jgi:hypothetical protein